MLETEAHMAFRGNQSSKRLFEERGSRKSGSEMGKHATEGRDLDESLTGLRQALMVASEATPSGDPGDAAFHDPPFRQNGKASLGHLPRWLGVDQALIASSAQATHGLNIPPQMLFDPI